MNWRDSRVELPEQNQIVWVMLEPHKERGGLLNSAPSIEIVCGWTEYSNDGRSCRVGNNDELGQGAISWYLKCSEEERYDYGHDYHGIAWLPVAEMEFPWWMK